MKLFFVCLALVLGTAACSDAELARDFSCEGSECDTEDASGSDTQDAAGPDFEFDSISNDSGTDEADSEPTLGEFGDACESDFDCESRYCLEQSDGSLCTRLCTNDCEDGYTCRLLVNSGGDAVSLCVPDTDVLCRACEEHTDCGDLSHRCLEQDNGTFCATDCSDDRQCPSGHGCNIHTEDDGSERWLCEPLLGVCQPVRLESIGPAPLAADVHSASYSLGGFVTFVPNTVSSESYSLSGGFEHVP